MSASTDHQKCLTDLLLINFERSFAITVRAITDRDFFACVLIKRPKYGPTLTTIELDIFQLRKHTTTTCHDARYADEVVQVYTPEIAQR